MIKKKNEVAVIIPARGGSKGIPRKNLTPLGGRPLITWTIDVALACPLVDRVIVSTEDQEIAGVSKAFGAEVPFLRAKDIAGDKALVGDAIRYTLRRLSDEEGYRPTHYVVLYPTSPFRTHSLLRRVLEPVLSGYIASMSVRRIWFSDDSYVSLEDGVISPLHGNIKEGWTYISTSSVQASRTIHFDQDYDMKKAGLRSFWGMVQGDPDYQRSLKFVEIDHPASRIDIDTPSDLELAEEVLRAGIFDSNRDPVRYGRSGILPGR